MSTTGSSAKVNTPVTLNRLDLTWNRGVGPVSNDSGFMFSGGHRPIVRAEFRANMRALAWTQKWCRSPWATFKSRPSKNRRVFLFAMKFHWRHGCLDVVASWSNIEGFVLGCPTFRRRGTTYLDPWRKERNPAGFSTRGVWIMLEERIDPASLANQHHGFPRYVKV